MSDTTTAPTLALPAELPVIPLLRTVVFPLTLQPLIIQRPAAVAAVNKALGADRLVLLLLQEGEDEEPAPEAFRRVGTAAVIRQMAKAAEGAHVIVEGLARVNVSLVSRAGQGLVATITPAPETMEPSIEVEAYHRRVRELVERALGLAAGASPELRGIVMSVEDPLRLCYLVGSLLDLKAPDKQQLLEEDRLLAKLRWVAAALEREISLLELKGKIESEVRQEMTAAERQYYLRQQLKTIQEELGEKEGADIQDVRDRVAQANLPADVAAAVARELDRLGRMTSASPEYQMIRTYVDWVLDVPWTVTTEDRIDPAEARRVLDEDHYDLDKVKERIVEYLAVRKLKGDMKGPILCFVGPPGVGKTSLGQSIARAMNRRFVRISLGGVRDEAEIRGHRRTYIGSMPGRIIQALKQAGSANPVFMLDEIDKVSAGGFQGDPAAALLEVLDPAQNNTFRDHFLEVPFDLSKVLFIATANQLGTVHPALLDRMEVIGLVGYTAEEKIHIARRYLIPRQLSEHGLSSEAVRIDDEALGAIIGSYTREAGVRQLERQVAAVARKVAARVATDGTSQAVADVDKAGLARYLGPPRFHEEVAFRTSRPGVATGLAWTETGGEVLFIEATLLPNGHEQIILTGHLGQVMQESARAAVSYIRANASALGIEPAFLEGHDLHIHVPAGAIPKDGPSAGVTIATAVLSAIRHDGVRENVAMTGEITLSGLVLPVGGIREKTLAARRHGIRTVLLPERNMADLEELPEQARSEMTFVPTSTIEQVIEAALPPTRRAASAPDANLKL